MYGKIIVISSAGIFVVLKPAASPTKLGQLKAIKTCDIINPSPWV